MTASSAKCDPPSRIFTRYHSSLSLSATLARPARRMHACGPIGHRVSTSDSSNVASHPNCTLSCAASLGAATAFTLNNVLRRRPDASSSSRGIKEAASALIALSCQLAAERTVDGRPAGRVSRSAPKRSRFASDGARSVRRGASLARAVSCCCPPPTRLRSLAGSRGYRFDCLRR
jgi:hypothetical protein